MKLIFTLILMLALGGCVTAPTIQVPPVVKVEVQVPCKTEEPAAPTLRFTPPYTDVFEAVRDLMGDVEVTTAYENELRIALKSCK
jgi:hypothetical protein